MTVTIHYFVKHTSTKELEEKYLGHGPEGLDKLYLKFLTAASCVKMRYKATHNIRAEGEVSAISKIGRLREIGILKNEPLEIFGCMGDGQTCPYAMRLRENTNNKQTGHARPALKLKFCHG